MGLWKLCSPSQNLIYRDGMTTRRKTLALWPLLLVLVVGCAQSPPDTADAGSTAAPEAPAFASEDEALAAATEAYRAYLNMSNAVAHDGGKESERMKKFATGDALQYEIQIQEKMHASERRGVGDVSFDSISLQKSDLQSGATVAYLCIDVSQTDIVDSTGASVLSQDRFLRFPLEVSFVLETDQKNLIMERSESWTGTNFC